MSDVPSSGPPPMAGPAGPFPPSMPPGPWSPPVPPTAPFRPARWQTWLTLLIALVALGVAVGAWLRPVPAPGPSADAAPTFSDQQVADAKAKVCAAFQKVRRAVEMNSSRDGGDDPNAQLLIAVNARQAFFASSEYLLSALADERAVPSELEVSVKRLADLYQVITLDGLASDRSIATQQAANEVSSTIESQCT